MNDNRHVRLLIGITGASGSIYAKKLLERIANMPDKPEQTAVIFSEAGEKVWQYELGDTSFGTLPFTVYRNDDLFAPPASGSAGFTAMVICPCSVGTLGRIAAGTAESLITRAADVMLKERRKLILVIREAPLNVIHIRNMETVTLAGGIIFPASPGFYYPEKDLDSIINHFVERVLETAGIKIHGRYSWGSSR
ncbi:MAG: UbiX family flavin prenyltransferase [Bacteroidales bacterium]|nr:UbiX family flavin prenyltransferase [Bacteroidales bacterium]